MQTSRDRTLGLTDTLLRPIIRYLNQGHHMKGGHLMLTLRSDPPGRGKSSKGDWPLKELKAFWVPV